MASEWQIIKDLYKGFGNNPRNAETFEALVNINPLFSAYRGAKTLSNVDVSPMRQSLLNEAYGISDPNVNRQAANQVKDTLFGLLDVAPVAGAATPAIKAGGKTLAKEAARQIETGTGLLGSTAIDPRMYITAYHGTPHEIIGGKFDLSKIGTGEGAQAYGHGLYFAESPAVAKTYQMPSRGAEATAAQNLKMYKNPERAIEALEEQLTSNITELGRQHTQEAINLLKSGKATTGNLYKVDIADETIPKMLDWNKPISEQSIEVQKALSPYMKEYGLPSNETGSSAYSMMLDILGKKKGLGSGSSPSSFKELAPYASEELNRAGIPGIKYLDAASRSGNEGTRNFVVFNPDTVKILERNGLLLP
jgi:hypothetical protein